MHPPPLPQSVVADLYMEAFEKRALDMALLSQKCTWFVDDILFIWSHGKEKLMDFVSLLNSLHQRIKFMVELEIDGTLPFLDILLIKKPGGT